MTVVDSIDLFSDETLANPYPTYQLLRDTGPAVFLPQANAWAVSRYEDVRWCLAHPDIFASAQGVGLNDDVNRMTVGSVLTSDGALHTQLRDVLTNYMAPRALRAIEDDIALQAHHLVQSVVEAGTFDAVTKIARVFPLVVVSDLVGLPVDGREKLLDFADGFFNMLGPGNERTWMGAGVAAGIVEYLTNDANRDQLAPGGWGAAIYEASDRGDIGAESIIPLMAAYITAAMDTTVNSISSAIMLMCQHTEVWSDLRTDPSRVPQAFLEVLRLESPVQVFSRTATTTHRFGDVTVRPGDRILVLYGSANRDERRWPAPETFDINRDTRAHLAFGYGSHRCAGQGLARIEAHAILSSLVTRVDHLELDGEPVRHLNNTVRGLKSLPVRAECAAR